MFVLQIALLNATVQHLEVANKLLKPNAKFIKPVAA